MARIIDLTLPLEPSMRGVDFEPARRLEVNGWNALTLHLYSHCGTHMDAPRHFLADGETIDNQPLEACIGPARLLDLTPTEPRELITPERLSPWIDSIKAGDRLVLRTDWSKRHGTSEYRDALPRVSLELARWLVDRGVSLIGVEPPSVADVNNSEELTTVHRTLLGAGIVIVEGLSNLDQITQDAFQLIVLPLKVHDGDGAPVRAVAIEDASCVDG